MRKGKLMLIGNVDEYGRRLFKAFRKQQKGHDNIGCECMVCEKDMVAALHEVLRAEGVVLARPLS